MNDELQQLDTDCTVDSKHPQLASHLLVLMVRGIFFKLDFPYMLILDPQIYQEIFSSPLCGRLSDKSKVLD